jgi:phosphomannomutase
LPEHLKDLSAAVVKHKAHVGIAVDPDVDRLALVNEDGTLFGEEYTLVACADHVLAHRPGDTVSNLSSTRALNDIAERHGRKRHASAVGEVNVVTLMKEVNAPIGGEGNGGVILSELHYGRDALVGIAIFLTLLAKSGKTCLELRKSYPDYFISKNKIELNPVWMCKPSWTGCRRSTKPSRTARWTDCGSNSTIRGYTCARAIPNPSSGSMPKHPPWTKRTNWPTGS